MHTLRPYVETDRDAVRDLLVAAFSDDPAYAHAFPDDRERALGIVLPALVSIRASTGGTLTVVEIQDRVVGIRSSTRSTNRPGLATYLRHGLARMPFTLGLTTLRRMLSADAEMAQLRNLVQPLEAHAYLAQIAVHPDHQKTGAGSALMRDWLDEVDRSQQAAALLTSRAQNVIWYERFGFEIAGQVGIAREFTAWCMVRAARTDR